MKNFLLSLRNSRLHYFMGYLLEKFDMAGFSLSYSQCGEDMILKILFGKNKRKGFYVDVGCNNPIQNNNTFKLYLKGWKGINIDGNQMLIDKCRKIRKRDLCLNEIVSSEIREIVFFQDNDNPELSSIDDHVGKDLQQNSSHVREIRRTSTTLEAILDAHLGHESFDFLCIDVEGHDFEVLKGNNFDKYRPRIICMETGDDPRSIFGSDLHSFLEEKKYALVALSFLNVFYKDLLV